MKIPREGGSGGEVPESKRLRRLKSMRNAARFATENTKGSRRQTRRRFVVRKMTANSRSNNFVAISIPLCYDHCPLLTFSIHNRSGQLTSTHEVSAPG